MGLQKHKPEIAGNTERVPVYQQSSLSYSDPKIRTLTTINLIAFLGSTIQAVISACCNSLCMEVIASNWMVKTIILYFSYSSNCDNSISCFLLDIYTCTIPGMCNCFYANTGCNYISVANAHIYSSVTSKLSYHYSFFCQVSIDIQCGKCSRTSQQYYGICVGSLHY